MNPYECEHDPRTVFNANHDWRLWQRERRVNEFVTDKPVFWREVWYCTQCRGIDEREVDDAPNEV